MTNDLNRRSLLRHLSVGSVACWAGLQMDLTGNSPLNAPSCSAAEEALLFKISVAQWSFHRTIRSGKLDNLDFAKISKERFGIDAIEYVNQFFKDKAKDKAYLKQMKQRAADHGVKSLLIMVDGEGQLGNLDEKKRTVAVENHYRWVEAAKFLGCHAIRVNAASGGTYDQQMERAADGLRRVSQFAAPHGLSVIVENHGGLSSNGKWLAATIKQVNEENCVRETMPFAKAVSAKSHDFDKQGNETRTDYLKMMKIVLAAGYHGYVGIEYEGGKLDEFAGVEATHKLLLRVRKDLA